MLQSIATTKIDRVVCGIVNLVFDLHSDEVVSGFLREPNRICSDVFTKLLFHDTVNSIQNSLFSTQHILNTTNVFLHVTC